MKKQDWDEWEKLHEEYEKARQEYEAAHDNLRGTFSELSRHYDRGTLDQNGFVKEQRAHERFLKARERVHAFIENNVN
ncbi:hypothetical protein [Hyphococcus sp.]|uniref:hypothetical protein n=1 Tax=Hyphococcus sp. TaxID=2038636 RepID=UPI003CCB8BAF